MTTPPGSIPTMPSVVPFVEKTHGEVIAFLQSFNSKISSFTDVSKTHKEVQQIETVNAVAAALFALSAACAYKMAHQYVAYGLGAIAVVSLLTGLGKKQKPTQDFAEFVASCTQAAAHLRNAFASKAKFMVDTANAKADKWTGETDHRLSEAYDDPNTTEENLAQVDQEQAEWRKVQKQLSETVLALELPKEQQPNTHLQAEIEKLVQARDIFFLGQTPPAQHKDNQTYIQYPQGENRATVWPSPVRA